MWMLLIALLMLAAPQLPPPNLVENGDARAGHANWTPSRHHKPVTGEGAANASVESCDGVPCFVLRNGAAWNQQIRLLDDATGKFLLIIARGASERIPEDGSITGRPYLWAHLVGVEPPQKGVLQGMSLQPKAPNVWGTMHGVFRMPTGVSGIRLMIAQAEGRGTPQNGSAARVKDVEVRLFETRDEADAYLRFYESQYLAR